ncbi:chromobox-like protein 5 [Dinothrombium tinctorium]|uniref:Chromobox-like protein 5 n=1 Tax=Dinothrombium tinctorium TaxID=1965070 RepID=A0A443RGZ5_9ACAR|nr:chromobox-like protein 5 [Dinothrombium tinctorium]
MDNLSSQMSDVYEVEEIRGRRHVNGRDEFLIKWKGYDEESWEPASNIIDKTLIENYEQRENSERNRTSKRNSTKKNKRGKMRQNEDSDSLSDTRKPKKSKTSVIENVSSDKSSKSSVHTSEKHREYSGESKKQQPIDADQNPNDSSKHPEVDKILGATEIDGTIYFLIKWKDSNKEPSPVAAPEANIKWPRMVISFYEQHFKWVPSSN